MNQSLIRTVLADDHRIFCDGVSQLLTQTARFHILKQFHDGNELLEDFHRHECDLLLLDIEIPGVNGLDILSRIRLKNSTTKIVMLSMHEASIFARKAKEGGANGYLNKSIESAVMIQSLIDVIGGKKIFEINSLQSPVREGLLSEKEVKVLRMIAYGKTSTEISDELMLSVLTVKTHRQNLMRKLDADNSAKLISEAFARGIL